MRREQDDIFEILDTQSFNIEGDVHRLVTFLNRTLKRKGYVFGLTQEPDGKKTFTIYRVSFLKNQQEEL